MKSSLNLFIFLLKTQTALIDYIDDKYKLFKKAGGRLALSLYVFLPTACFHFEVLELVHVDLF